jgi:DNA-binding GntR family transcriptional regulator
MNYQNKRMPQQQDPKRVKAGATPPADDGSAQPAIHSEGAFHLPPSLRESVYTYLKERIIRNKISPGTTLYVDRLATELGVSRTPIREALLWLEGEQFVESNYKQGFVVTHIERSYIEHVYRVRLILESEAIVRATELIPEALLDHVEQLFDVAATEINAGEFRTYFECDHALHHMVLDYADNPVLAQIARSLFERSVRIRYLADGEAAEHVDGIMAEHRAILRGLRSRRAEDAREAMAQHLAQACTRALASWHHLQQ